MGISIRAYARQRGVSDAAVRKAIQSGRIRTEADGTLDPAKADRDWARNSEPLKAGQQVSLPAHHTPDSPSSSLTTSGTSLLQAKTVNEVVKAQTNKVRLAKLKGELVDRNQAIAQVFKLARSERDAWLNWPARVSAEMAAKLGVDAHALHVALETAVREHLQELGEVRPRVE